MSGRLDVREGGPITISLVLLKFTVMSFLSDQVNRLSKHDCMLDCFVLSSSNSVKVVSSTNLWTRQPSRAKWQRLLAGDTLGSVSPASNRCYLFYWIRIKVVQQLTCLTQVIPMTRPIRPVGCWTRSWRRKVHESCQCLLAADAGNQIVACCRRPRRL